jgi:hypothetical protein
VAGLLSFVYFINRKRKRNKDDINKDNEYFNSI